MISKPLIQKMTKFGVTMMPASQQSSSIGDDQNDTDESGLEKETDRGPEIEVPFDPTKIDIIAKPMTISSLQDRLENDELDLTPEFQRQANVWDAKRKSRLIESILLRIPLPSFYFSEDGDGVYAVVDGLQRLCAIFHFMDCTHLNRITKAKLNPLRLTGLQYLHELDDLTFTELDRKFKRRVSELEITSNVIRANTPIAVKFNVFARLNQGGMPLVAQEIRNAIFPGNWRRHIREMAESDIFVRVTEGRIRTERQQDMELALRYVALWQLGKPFRRPANQTLDEFLNEVVEKKLTLWAPTKWKEVYDDFIRALNACKKVFGNHVFRKSWGNQYKSPINRGLFEAQLIALGGLSDEQLKFATTEKDKIIVGFAEAFKNDQDFRNSLTYGTGSAEASDTRIAKMGHIVKEAIDA